MTSPKEEFTIKTLSAMEKVFPNKQPKITEKNGICLKNSRYNFQIAVNGKARKYFCKIKVEGALADFITVREVQNVPVNFAFPEYNDDPFVLSKKAGLYPDLLAPITSVGYPILVNQWKAFFLTVTPNGNKALPIGKHEIIISALDVSDIVLAKTTYSLEVLDDELPELPIFNINWIHYDCISNYYNVPVFSERFNELLDEYVKNMLSHDINSILVPLFTPPLDTAIGKERKTAQLVKVELVGDTYEFNLEPLRIFIRRMRALGVKYFEFSHLFTQWGGTSCPKVVTTENGEEKQIFGWDTPSDSEAYISFLTKLLPKIVKLTEEEGVKKDCFWHITDEPSEKAIPLYSKLKEVVQKLVGDMEIIDALSEYAFYKKKLVTIPVVETTKFKDFQNKCDKFAVYYCYTIQENLSNRFISLPGLRTRILGLQCYMHNVAGFLHWGYNFWNNVNSLTVINPWLVNDAVGAYPAGDSFIVYPDKNGPLDSLRLEILSDGWQDYRIAMLAERYAGRETIQTLLEEEGIKDFDVYPHESKKYLKIRKKLLDIIRIKCSIKEF